VPDLAVIAMRDLHRIRCHDGNLMIAQIDDSVGVARQRRCVTGDEVLVVADAHHQRTAESRGDDHAGIVAKHDDESIRSAQLT